MPPTYQKIGETISYEGMYGSYSPVEIPYSPYSSAPGINKKKYTEKEEIDADLILIPEPKNTSGGGGANDMPPPVPIKIKKEKPLKLCFFYFLIFVCVVIVANYFFYSSKLYIDGLGWTGEMWKNYLYVAIAGTAVLMFIQWSYSLRLVNIKEEK